MTDSRKIDYQQLLAWRRSHPAWRLLLADHAPMIASFLQQAFVATNARGVAREQLATLLEDHLFRLHDAAGETLYPKAATAYLDDWASDARGWLRKYYPSGLDEPHYDLTTESELALAWMRQLDDRAFIGTEARFDHVRHALQQIVDATELSPRERIAQLRARQAEIDAEIARIEQGRLELMEPARIRERVNYAAETLAALLSDQRALEDRFRGAGRALRERMANQEEPVADTTADPFGETDEGASFRWFRQQLASPAQQAGLARLVDRVAALEPVRGMEETDELRPLVYQLVAASEATEQTVSNISRQWRRQVDERSRLENRRLMQLLRGVEQKALAVRDHAPEGTFIEIDEQSPTLALPMDRRLFNPPIKPRIRPRKVEQAPAVTLPAASLFARAQVDANRLTANVRQALRDREQVTLAEVVTQYPIREGLAELAAYLELAAHDLRCAIDPGRTEAVRWTDANGQVRHATLPLVIYTL